MLPLSLSREHEASRQSTKYYMPIAIKKIVDADGIRETICIQYAYR